MIYDHLQQVGVEILSVPTVQSPRSRVGHACSYVGKFMYAYACVYVICKYVCMRMHGAVTVREMVEWVDVAFDQFSINQIMTIYLQES